MRVNGKLLRPVIQPPMAQNHSDMQGQMCGMKYIILLNDCRTIADFKDGVVKWEGVKCGC